MYRVDSRLGRPDAYFRKMRHLKEEKVGMVNGQKNNERHRLVA